MCLAVPLKIDKIDGKNAMAGIDGIFRNIRIDFTPDVKAGDYVIVHAGFAIEVLSEETAEENLRAIREVSHAVEK